MCFGSVVIGAVYNPEMSVQTPCSAWCGERCVSVAQWQGCSLQQRFVSIQEVLDVASCNNKYCCLSSCAEVLTGTGLKYVFPNIVESLVALRSASVFGLFSGLGPVCVGLDYFFTIESPMMLENTTFISAWLILVSVSICICSE